MISTIDVHSLDARKSLCFEEQGNAMFDNGISSVVGGSRTKSLLQLGREYTGF